MPARRSGPLSHLDVPWLTKDGYVIMTELPIEGTMAQQDAGGVRGYPCEDRLQEVGGAHSQGSQRLTSCARR